MPGIAGILAAGSHPGAPQQLESMLQSMMHEPFYTRQSHLDTEHGWYTGRVSIAGSYSDRAPVSNPGGRVVLLAAGECFLDSATKSALRNGGPPIDTAGASSLAHLYEKEGVGFAAKINGLCSGILLDSSRGKAVLFNDRFGLQRIYWHENASGFYFASEAKALLAALPHLREANVKSIAEYLCFDCIVDEKSFFKDVQVLPAGSLWVHANGHMERGLHFDASKFEGQSPLDEEEFSGRLSAAFQEAILRRTAGVPVGLALTGGLDTRLIAACLPRGFHNVTPYTFGGIYGDSADVLAARKICKGFGVPHHTLRIDSAFLAHYRSHAARATYVTDGLADAMSADSMYLNGRARELASVKITGAFGSQVLGRVKRSLRYRLPSRRLVAEEFLPLLEGAAEGLTPWRGEHALTFCLKREIPAYWSRFIGCELSQVSLRLPFLDNDFVELLYRAPSGGYDGSQFEIAAITRLKGELLAFRTNKGALGSGPLFVKAAFKKAARVRTLVEGALVWDSLPHSLHHVAARMDASVLTPLRLNKLILGSEYFRHYSHWFRNELAPFLKEVILDPVTLARPYWNPVYVTSLVSDHVSGRRNNMGEIRKVLAIEGIHRELLSHRG
jgi:asparagine synthase (glutamine-hydrolysing)